MAATTKVLPWAVLAMLATACDTRPQDFFAANRLATDTVDTTANTSKPATTRPRKKPAVSSNASRDDIATDSAAEDLVALMPSAFVMVDSTGPFGVEDRFFTVLFDRERFGSGEHVRRVQIRDERGAIHYEERIDPPMNGADAAWTMTVRAYALRGERGQGVVLYYQQMPSAPLSGMRMRIFGLQGSQLTPIAPHLSVHGIFGELQESRETNVLFLGPDERIDTEVWQGYFAVNVPLRVRLRGCTEATRPCIRPLIRRGDIVPGLSILRVTVPQRDAPSPVAIQLFDAPEGTPVARVQLTRNSEISIHDVAVDVFIETQNGVDYVRTRREWLRVRLDGRDGWIHGAESFAAIGLLQID